MTKRFTTPIALLAFLWTFLATTALSQSSLSLSPMTGGSVYATPNMDMINAQVKVSNYGTQAVTDFDYSLYYLDSQLSEGPFSIHLDAPLAQGETTTISVPIKCGEATGTTDVVFSIGKVNGDYNQATINYTYITRYTVSVMPHKRVVVEDYTGLWCQFCPRGIVVMEALQRLYPNDFIGIAIHCRDELSTGAYGSDMENKWAPGKPSIWFDRTEKINDFSVESMFHNMQAKVSPLNIEVAALWNADSSNVNVTTSLTACMQPANGDAYALAYVLTEDGMQNDNWVQYNKSSEWRQYVDAPEELDFFRNAPYFVYGLTYNHVAIAAQGIEQGIEGSVPTNFDGGDTFEHTTTFDNLSQYYTVQSKKQLAVCALLINTRTHQIANAAKCTITSNTTTNMTQTTLSTTTTTSQHFDIDGRRISPTTPGIHIIRNTDGSVSKKIK